MAEVIKVEDCGNNIGDYDIPIYNAIIIPDGATNGDMIKAMFPNDSRGFLVVNIGRNDWWNTPYKKEVENERKNILEL